jgi:hypothetical protein
MGGTEPWELRSGVFWTWEQGSIKSCHGEACEENGKDAQEAEK